MLAALKATAHAASTAAAEAAAGHLLLLSDIQVCEPDDLW